MDLKKMNELLSKNNISMEMIKKMAKKYESLDLSNDDNLRKTINDIAKLLGKNISLEAQNQMIETIKKGDFKM